MSLSFKLTPIPSNLPNPLVSPTYCVYGMLQQTCQPPRIGRGNPRIPCIPRIHSRMQNLPRLLSCFRSARIFLQGEEVFPASSSQNGKFGHDEIIPSNICTCDRAFSWFRCGMPLWRYINMYMQGQGRQGWRLLINQRQVSMRSCMK